MVRCVWLCPCYSAIRPAFLFGGHFLDCYIKLRKFFGIYK